MNRQSSSNNITRVIDILLMIAIVGQADAVFCRDDTFTVYHECGGIPYETFYDSDRIQTKIGTRVNVCKSDICINGEIAPWNKLCCSGCNVYGYCVANKMAPTDGTVMEAIRLFALNYGLYAEDTSDVLRAKGLLTKGKNGTNNCFATIEVGKEKYATSIKESSPPLLEWHEECELSIPDKGNRAELIVKCLHRNNFSVDEFLGQVTLPLNEMDVYEKPRSKWYKLQSKPGKDKKDKDRGELELRIAFTVKSGSLMDLSKKEKKGSTLGLGGSLLSINTLEKKKKLKDFAKSLGSKVHLTGKPKKDKNTIEAGSNSGSVSSIGTPGSGVFAPRRFGQSAGDADPGVISEDEDEFVFDKLSHKSSGSSLNVAKVPMNPQQLPPPSPLASNSSKSNTDEDIRLRSKTLPPSKPPRINGEPNAQKVDEWEAKLYGKHLEVGSSDSLKRRSWESSRVLLSSQQELNESTKEPTHEHVLANTAPTTPNLEDQKRTTTEQVDKPRPLPRSATLESIVEKEIKDEVVEKKPEKRLSKFKYFRKEKTDSLEDLKHKLGNKQFGERIIIGHENDIRGNGAEVPQELLKKYDGKSREDIILIANDMENEVRMQKMKMKEMEDYLDNLLLRVMETQPKLLQNPYRSHNSTKSG